MPQKPGVRVIYTKVRSSFRRPKTAKDLENHARRKAQERYGRIFSSYEFWTLLQLIKANHVILINKRSNLRSILEVTFQGQTYVLVYDYKREMIATFLCRRHQTRELAQAS